MGILGKGANFLFDGAKWLGSNVVRAATSETAQKIGRTFLKGAEVIGAVQLAKNVYEGVRDWATGDKEASVEGAERAGDEGTGLREANGDGFRQPGGVVSERPGIDQGCFALVGTGPEGGPQRPYLAMLEQGEAKVYSLVPVGRPERGPDGSVLPAPGLLLENNIQDRERCGAALSNQPGHNLVSNREPLSLSQAAQVRADAVEPYRTVSFQIGFGHSASSDLALAAMNATGRVQDAERGVESPAQMGAGAAGPGRGLPPQEPCQCPDRFGSFQFSLTMGGPGQTHPVFSMLGLADARSQTIRIEVEISSGRDTSQFQVQIGHEGSARGRGGPEGGPERGGAAAGPPGSAAPRPGPSFEEVEQRNRGAGGEQERGE